MIKNLTITLLTLLVLVGCSQEPTELEMERAETEIERLISEFGLMFMRRHENGNLNVYDFNNSK